MENLVSKYKSIVNDNRSKSLPFYSAVFDFIEGYASKVGFDALIKMFEFLMELEGSSVDCHFGLGFLHLAISSDRVGIVVFDTKILLYEISWPRGTIKIAFSHFNKARKILKNNPLIYSLLIRCLIMKGYSDLPLRLLNKISQAEISKTENVIFNYFMRETLFFLEIHIVEVLLSHRDHNRALERLQKAKNLVNDKNKTANLLLRVLLYRAYIMANQPQEALFELKKARKDFPHVPLFYDLIGRVYWATKRFKLAAFYLEKAVGLYVNFPKRQTECFVLLEFSTGMYIWRNAKPTDRTIFNEILDHFNKCVDLIKRHDLEDTAYNKFKILPSLIDIDERIYHLKQSSNLENLYVRLKSIMQSLYYCDFKFEIYNYHTKMLIDTDIISLVFSAKMLFIDYLVNILEKGSLSVIDELPDGSKIKREVLFSGWLNDCVLYLRKQNFKKEIVAFENLEIFKNRINNRSINEIPMIEQRELITILFWDFEIMGGSFSCKSLERIDSAEISAALRRIENGQNVMINGISKVSEEVRRIPSAFISESVKLDETIKRIWKSEAPKEIPEIVFAPEHVRINRLHNPILQPILERSRERYFLEYLFLKGQIHYLHCFVILKERGIDFNPEEFINQPDLILKKIKSNLNTILRPFRDEEDSNVLPFRIEGPNRGYFILKIDERKQFNSNIIEAKEKYGTALSLFNDSKFSESIEKLHGKNGAIDKYFNYMDAYKLLAKCYIKLGLQNIEMEKIQEVRRFLARRFSWHKEGVQAINKYLSTTDTELLGNENEIFDEIKRERDEICELLSQLTQNVITKSEEDITWDTFDAIQDVVMKHGLEKDNKAVTIELLNLKAESMKIIRELLSEQVKEEISKLRFIKIEGQTDDEIREKYQKKESEILLTCIETIINLLRGRRYRRSDFDSWQDCVKHIGYHIGKSIDPPAPSQKANRRVRRYVREYLKIVEREDLNSKSIEEQTLIFKKYGFGKKRLQDVRGYLELEKEVTFNDERDKGNKIL